MYWPYLQLQLNYEDMWIFLAEASFESLLLKMAATVMTVEFGTILVWRKILKRVNETLCELN